MTNAFSLKGIATITLILTGFATAGLVVQSNRQSQPSQAQYPHGMSYGEVWQVTRVVSNADILVED